MKCHISTPKDYFRLKENLFKSYYKFINLKSMNCAVAQNAASQSSTYLGVHIVVNTPRVHVHIVVNTPYVHGPRP